MPRESEPSVNEKAFVLQALQEHIRMDGRGLDELRSLDLQLGDEYGVADVRWGKTRWFSSCRRCKNELVAGINTAVRVIARISAEITKPYVDRPSTGIFTISTELSSMASPAFEAGRLVIPYFSRLIEAISI